MPIREHGLFFAPELSPSNRATIGGMIATDASGQGSVLYGKTHDHVLELKCVLLDGTPWHSVPLSAGELDTVKRRTDRVGDVHRVLDRIRVDDAELIAERFPPLNRCVTGYDLVHLRRRQGRFNLNSVLCGAEGTLAFVTEAKVNLVPIPHFSAIVSIRYETFDAALRDAARSCEWRPHRARRSTPRCSHWLAVMRYGSAWRNTFPTTPRDRRRA